ncbi:hypothetical protein ACFQE1_12390 [Halobium palmae]|uniref:Uncharacterized protein n=1 Tax=Halobium palmae TaxID=1776492 RepID=A0ABD5S0G6_9EURY
MERRSFVAALATGASVALSGCTGGESGAGTETGTDGSGETTAESGTTTGSDADTTTATSTPETTTAGEAETTTGEPETTGTDERGTTGTDEPESTDGPNGAGGGSNGSFSVADTEFTPRQECSGSTGASVELGSGSVRATGCIRGSNGCHVAVLEDVAVDGETLQVTVTTEAEGDGPTACTQQIVERGYEATVTTTGGLPSTVEVRHVEMGETRTVATVER